MSVDAIAPDAIVLGPLVLPLDRLIVLLGAFSFLFLAWLLRRRAPGLDDWATWSLLAGLAGGRLGHVIQYPGDYADAPWELLYLWQDGYALWGVILGMLLASAILFWRQGLAPTWMAVSLAPGLLVLALGFGSMQWLAGEGPRLDEHSAQTLGQETVSLDQAAAGRPSGVFLWATWCGICRQMMPDVIEAAERRPEARWLLVNMGETAGQVEAYFEDEGYALPDNVELLLDPRSQLLDEWNAHGIPTTLIFDASGEQSDRFMGRRSQSRLLIDEEQ